MRWNKRGLVYEPSGDRWWARSYALLPTADVVDGQTLRIYFASLDDNRYGRIGYVDLDADNPQRIKHETREPILDIGELGTFDDSGVNPSCVISLPGKKYLYYIGWQRCERVPYMLFTGLATSADGGSTFERTFRTPVLERTNSEPFLRSAPTIILDRAHFKAWYVSGIGWKVVNGRQYPSYVIRFAESSDGVRWTSHARPCITFEDRDEFGFGRPWVIKEQNTYKMWYSIRSAASPYRIGYAESDDGTTWLRKDQDAGIERSPAGWDSEMVCYPCVVDVNGNRFMFYNGNQHGSTGFGYAVLET
jgi:hypothetical protein